MKTAHKQTLRQRIEALRDEVESISLDNHIYGDGEGIRASAVVARLTDALALPDGPEPGAGAAMTDLKIAWAEAPEGHYVWRRLKRDHPHAMPGDRWFISRKDVDVLPTGYEFARAEQQPGELTAERQELYAAFADTIKQEQQRTEQAEADLATLRAGIAALTKETE